MPMCLVDTKLIKHTVTVLGTCLEAHGDAPFHQDPGRQRTAQSPRADQPGGRPKH